MPMLMIGIFDIGRGSSDDSGGFGDIGMTTMTIDHGMVRLVTQIATDNIEDMF